MIKEQNIGTIGRESNEYEMLLNKIDVLERIAYQREK